MRTQFAVAAFVGSAFASLEGYAPPPTTSCACDTASTYPAGQVCTEINGSLTLATVASSTTSCSEEATTTVPAASVTTPAGYVSTPAGSTSTPATSPMVPESTGPATSGSVTASASIPVYSVASGTPSSSMPVMFPVTSGTPSSSMPVMFPVASGTPSSSVPVLIPLSSGSVSSPVGYATASTSVLGPTSASPVVPVSMSTSCASASTWTEVVTHTAAGDCTTVSATGLLTAPAPSGTMPSSPHGYGNVTVPTTGSVAKPSSTSPVAYTGAASKLTGGAVFGLSVVVAALFL